MLINFNHLKTLYSALVQKMKRFRGNWNQNDPTAEDYIKNRPFYSEVKKQTITLVDNLASDTDHGYWPKCTFIPGQSYDVTYNGVLYPNLVCYQAGGYNIICEDVPCYIDDDGGNSLYIHSDDDSWIISITTVEENEIVHKLDKKFIDMPDGIVTEDNLGNILENNLAPVAFDGSYTSLHDTPTIYTDVVRHDVIQRLSDDQKLQARNNIGAGTSMFDGSYNNILYKPCGIETMRTEFIKWHTSPYSTGHSSNIKSAIVASGNTSFPVVGSKYEISICKGTDTNEVYTLRTKAEEPAGYPSSGAITIGNPYLFYAACEDNGEPICVMFYTNGQINYYVDTNVFGTENKQHYVTINKITEGIIQKFDPRLVPNIVDLTGYATEEYVDSAISAIPTPDVSGQIAEHNTSEDAHSDIRILVESLTEQLNAITGAKDSIVLNDSVTGFEYVVQVQNGNLVSSLKCTGIEITNMPDKAEYTDGEKFDPTGMVVVATYSDGSTKEISDYTYYSGSLTEDMDDIEISYTEAGFTYTDIAHISVGPFDAAKSLIDFDYTDNQDGTYTITGWKQTLNGEPSTELIVPDNPSIIV